MPHRTVSVPALTFARTVRYARLEQAHCRDAYYRALRQGGSSALLAMLRGRWQAAADAAGLLESLVSNLNEDARALIESHADLGPPAPEEGPPDAAAGAD